MLDSLYHFSKYVRTSPIYANRLSLNRPPGLRYYRFVIYIV